MERRRLGQTGTWISALGFGCGTAGGLLNNGPADEQRAVIARAIEAGITYFDTAPNYGDGQSERNLGRVLRELGVRDQVQIGTKIGLLEADRADAERRARSVLDGSLGRLGTDHVDLLFLHSPIRPSPDERSTSTPHAHEAAALLARIKAEGRTALTGFTAHGATEAAREVVAAREYDVAQVYFSAANPSAVYAGASGGQQDFGGLLAQAADHGLGVISIQPLSAGGLLDRPHPYARDFMHGRLLGVGATLARLAEAWRLDTVYELALRFALSQAATSCVLVGFSSLEQLEQDLAWAARGPLSDEQVQAVVDVGVGPVGLADRGA